MSGILLVLVVLALLWWFNRHWKPKKSYVVKTDKRITYRELASKRHKIHIAQKMIVLGLVENPTTAADRILMLIYDGLDVQENPTMARVAYLYGLDPLKQGFVGY